MKTAEAAYAGLLHAAQPVPLWPSLNADGVEDSLTNTPLAARALVEVADFASRLCAIELLVAARAVELRAIAARLGPPMQDAFEAVRALSAPLEADRPLGTDIERVATAARSGAFHRGGVA